VPTRAPGRCIVLAVQRWSAYWFRAGGRYSCAALRIAIGTSILWMLWRLHGGYRPDSAPHDVFRAVGIGRIVGELGPTLYAIVTPIAWLATVALIVGAWSRASCAVSFVAALILASYEASFAPTWSHDNNAPLLAQLAFLGAHGGDVWSLDAWWRKRRGGTIPDERAYLWSVLLVQLAVALMMASAAYAKLLSGGPTLAWVLSDNLRNQILVRFDLRGIPRPPIAEWLVAEPLRWKTAAFLNIIAQLAPLAACFAVRWPRVRAALGALFVTEVIGLDVVMGFENFHWLPLAAAFVDWDALLHRQPPIPRVEVPRAARIFVAAFVIVDVVIAFYRWPALDQRLNLYPLSSFPMFASIRAVKPYSEHHVYELSDVRLELVTTPPAGPPLDVWCVEQARMRRLANVRTRAGVQDALGAIASAARATHPQYAISAVRLYRVAIEAPPYPEPARLVRHDVGVMGELTLDDNRFTSELAPLARTPDGSWVAATAAPLAVYRDGALRDLATSRDGNRQRFELPSGPVHVLARTGERLFLVESRQ
jgi:hypothetical protein